jgi:hypothetical protein
MLAHNLIRKCDQPVVYTSRFLNKVERNYNTIKHETLVIVTLHTFKHYLLGNKFVSYVGHRDMVRTPKLLGRPNDESKGENNQRIRSWGMFLNSQHFEGKGA